MKKLLLLAPLSMFLASGIAHAEGDMAPMGKHPRKMEQALSKLPADKAAAFKAVMEKNKAANEATIEQIKKLEDKKFDILSAEKFDQAAYVATTGEIHKLRQTIMSSHCDAFANFAAGLSQAERKTLADSLKKGHGKMREMHGDND